MKKKGRFFIFLVKWFFLISLAIIIFNSFILKPLLSSSFGLYWDTDFIIGRARWDWTLPGLTMEEVKIGNPYGFPRGEMLQVDRIIMRFDFSKDFLVDGKVKPDSLEIQIKKIELMRRVSGHLNLHLFTHPENIPNKRRGLGLSPRMTKITVEDISETDATQPILKRQMYSLPNKEFEIGEKSNFRIIAQIFVAQLFQRIGLSEEGNMPALPAPQYHGIASSVEQEIKEHAESVARDESAAAKFETLLDASDPSAKAAPKAS